MPTDTAPETKPPKPVKSPRPPRSRFTTWLFGWLLGNFGADRFYLGQIWTGILKLITMGGFGIWTMIDLIYTAFGDRKDKQGRSLEGTVKERRVLRIITILMLVIQLLLITYFVMYGIPAAKRDAFRTADAKSIQSTLTLYQTDINAELPKTTDVEATTRTIKFCDTSCENGSAFVPLRQYDPKKVVLKTYQAGLSTPDPNTVIVMTNATCNGPKTHAMAILYMTEGFALAENSTAQHCITVEPKEFNHIADPPTCSLKITDGMPESTKQFIDANITYNKLRIEVGKEMAKRGVTPGATPTAIDLQIIADKQFNAAIEKINFTPAVKADINKLLAANQAYDTLLAQERPYLVANTNVPTQLMNAMDANNTDHTAAYFAVKKDLNLPASSCQFITP